MSMLPPPEENPQALDEAIDEALDGSLRASQWQELTEALRLRAERLSRELDRCEDEAERQELQRRLAEVEEQQRVLAEEEAITRFVENAVKFSYEVRRHTQG